MDFKKFIGIPYQSKGRDYEGLDCWGLVRLVLKEGKGIDLIDGSGLYRSAADRSVSSVILEHRDIAKPVQYEARKPLDLILFNIHGLPVHIGVILDKNTMLHTLKGHNSCLEKYTGFMWQKRIEGIYRVE